MHKLLLALIFCCLMIYSTGCRHPAIPDESWSSLTASESTTIIFKPKGRAEVTKVSRRQAGGSLFFVHTDKAKWGVHKTTAHPLLPGVPRNEPMKRYLWVSVKDPKGQGEWRFDYVDVGDKMYEVDKTGIQATLFRCDNGDHRGAEEKPLSRVAGWSLSMKGFGPLHVGMTVEEAEKILKVDLEADRKGNPNDCHYAMNGKSLPGLSFMVLNGQIVRIDVTKDFYKTSGGARIGMTEEQVRKLYPRGDVSGHPYDKNGHTLRVSDKGAKHGLIFETDGKLVTSFRAGKYTPVQWIEGCE
ncbi:MAG: hypothetical protein LHV69_09630 [Elusimicrobia bacterium]|nr:hypothetical protein [Candidatus Obscuribacterium magneticum]